VIDALAKPFSIEGHEIFITASIGISIFPADGDSVDALLKNADSAMYHAKESGRNNFQYYSNTMNAAATKRLELEVELRHATEREEFVVYYQPQVDLRTRQIIGGEALVRWQHPKRGLLAPGEFLPVAVESGLIRLIDEWVLRTACRQNREWQDRGLPSICVSVNVSNSLFHGSTLLGAVKEALEKTGLPPASLELELTESITMRKVETSIAMLHSLKAIGIQLSMDDFGTGYSSLIYLQRFPIDIVKIDQSFIRDLLTPNCPMPIIRAIIAMAHSLKLTVLAEGVEQEAQRTILFDEGCDYAQGYLFGRPMPADQFASLLSSHNLRKAS
jgi:EAL domain-containing protein (putative c-di-GMP-specific phosphodiesterase class I)